MQIYSPASGELLVTQTSRVTGERKSDPVEAERSAREKAVDAATKEAITKSLEKAHKIIIYQINVSKVSDRNHLLAIKEHLAKLQGVYMVREVTYDAKKGSALIEVIGSPITQAFWRAWLEKLPKTKITRYVQNEGLRNKYPSWFSAP